MNVPPTAKPAEKKNNRRTTTHSHMLPNLIIIVAGLFVLAFIALLWLRQNLTNALEALHQNELLLRKDLEKRRDLVPFLLEGAREAAAPTDTWALLVQKRSAFAKPSTLAQEFEYEKLLGDYLSNTSFKTVRYLEAKKEIQEVARLVEEQKEKLRIWSQHFNEKRKVFPYSLASGMFGIREVNPL